MTTKHSPLRILKAQAERIARMLLAAERGDRDAIGAMVSMPEKIQMARAQKSSIRVAIVMDDKTVTLELPWDRIRGVSEVALTEYILKQMREIREAS